MTQDNTSALDDLLTGWRQQAATAGYRRERDKGTAFENLCIAYLQHDPIQARQYEQPMLYSDWAQVPERRAGHGLARAWADAGAEGLRR